MAAGVEVRRHLSVPPAKVFAAFADQALVARWLSPSPEVELEVLQFDFCEGGRYRFAYHVPGSPLMKVNGRYRVIEPPTRIVFTWLIEPPDEHAGIDSEVTVTIVPNGSGSDLIIRHDKLVDHGAEIRHADGWRGALDRLDALLRE